MRTNCFLYILIQLIVMLNYCDAYSQHRDNMPAGTSKCLKTIKLLVDQTLKISKDKSQSLHLPLEELVRRLLGYAEIKVITSDTSDLDCTLRINVAGEAESAEYNLPVPFGKIRKYTGASISGTISFHVSYNAPPVLYPHTKRVVSTTYQSVFEGSVSPPDRIMVGDREYNDPMSAPFDKAFVASNFPHEMLEIIHKVYGMNPLISALKDEDNNVRSGAVEVLGETKDSSAVEPLISVLKDKEKYIRIAAVKALGQLKDPRVIAPLGTVLKNDEGDVRFATAKALGEIKDSRAVEPLIVALKDGDSNVRAVAANALGEIKDSHAVRPLIAILKDEKDSDVRATAAKALGEIKDSHAVEPLIAALKDDREWVVQAAAANALGEIKDSHAVEPLIDALKDGDSNVRAAAAEALGKLTDPRAIAPLILAFEDKTIRVVAMNSFKKLSNELNNFNNVIKNLNSPNVVKYLLAASKDEDRLVGDAAIEMLEKLNGFYSIESLISALSNYDSSVRRTAAVLLVQIGNFDVVLDRYDEEKFVELLQYIKIDSLKVDFLIFSLHFDKHPLIQKEAAEALRHSKDPRVVDPLIAALKAKAPKVRETAAEALGDLGDLRAIKPLMSTLKDTEPHVRFSAAKALGELKDPNAIEPLISALKKYKDWSNKSMLEALIRITGENFGKDHKAWEKWWKLNKVKFLKKNQS